MKIPVIIREPRKISGKTYDDILVYKSDKPITKEGRLQAESLDNIIKQKMKELEFSMNKMGYLNLKNKKGVIKLWYHVGKGINFINDTTIVPREDRKYVWRALYNHAGKLSPGIINERVMYRPMTSHFRYCNIISKYDWNFVESAGNWTAWVEFLDSPAIRDDDRVIDWLGSIQLKAQGSLQDWLRRLTKEIRTSFKNKDTSVFTDDELYNKLNTIFKNVYPDL